MESRLKELLLELRNPEVLQSPERARAIMEEHAQFNQLKKVLSPMVGKRIITRWRPFYLCLSDAGNDFKTPQIQETFVDTAEAKNKLPIILI